jgi:outer membrane protein assembly factor BamB
MKRSLLRPRRCAAACISVFAAFAAPVSPAPGGVAMFRGTPDHAGAYAAPPGHELGGVRWTFATNGAVRSSPAIVDGVVYVGSSDGYLYALNERTGRMRWRYAGGSAVTSSPAVAAGLVFAHTYDGRVFALRARDARPMWARSFGPPARLAWGHESGDDYASSPAIVGTRLYIGGIDGNLYALDARSGAVIWRLPTGGRIWSSPAVAGGAVYAGSLDGKLYKANAADGTLRWAFATDGAALDSGAFGYDRRTIQSSPSVGGGIAYVGSRDGTLYAVDAERGTLRWRFDNSVFWSNTSPARANGLVYAGNSDGLFVQGVDARSGKEAWKYTTALQVFASPSVAGDAVYTGDWAGYMYAVDAKTGALLWKYRNDGRRIMSSAAIDGAHLVFGSDDGLVYDLRLGTRALRRAVFYDAAYIKATHLRSSDAMRDYFSKRGYDVLDEAALAAFLRDRTADRVPSVVVFAIDHLPAALAGEQPRTGAFRRYLDAGGKVVWPGIAPLLFPSDPKTGDADFKNIGRAAAKDLLGVSFETTNFDLVSAVPTAAGATWGLQSWMLSSFDADAASVTTVLARDEWHSAAAWVKSYGGPPGSGFVRIPVVHNAEGNPLNLTTIQLAAERFPD